MVPQIALANDAGGAQLQAQNDFAAFYLAGLSKVGQAPYVPNFGVQDCEWVISSDTPHTLSLK